MTDLSLEVATHPLLDLGWFVVEYPKPLGELESPSWLTELFAVDAESPLTREEEVRAAVRDLLRHGGFKPTGRSKPASEYLVKAATDEKLGSINLAVDCGNAVSLHSGLPISVVDLGKAEAPFSVAIAPAGTSHVFNASGQEIDVSGLLGFADAAGPCANAVKDAQRTKTDASTVRTLALVWGTQAAPGRTEATVAWYRDVVARSGAKVM